MQSILSIQNLLKRYSDCVAVNDISFEIRPGEIVGLLGPNGAGKTTCTNMLMGVLEPTVGQILIDGINLLQQRSQALQVTNFAAVYSPLPGNLSVEENLKVFGLLYSVPELTARIAEVLQMFELQDLRKKRCGVLSSGEQTRVCLAKALLNKPKLLLLDEPTASLDPATARDLRRWIRGYVDEQGSAVLWTSHNMQEVSDVCDRVLFLSHGKILLEGDPKTLPQQYNKANLEDLFVAVAREPLSLQNSQFE